MQLSAVGILRNLFHPGNHSLSPDQQHIHRLSPGLAHCVVSLNSHIVLEALLAVSNIASGVRVHKVRWERPWPCIALTPLLDCASTLPPTSVRRTVANASSLARDSIGMRTHYRQPVQEELDLQKEKVGHGTILCMLAQ